MERAMKRDMKDNRTVGRIEKRAESGTARPKRPAKPSRRLEALFNAEKKAAIQRALRESVRRALSTIKGADVDFDVTVDAAGITKVGRFTLCGVGLHPCIFDDEGLAVVAFRVVARRQQRGKPLAKPTRAAESP